mmetsp:Transcript_53147/g.113505  ORF Transcript_53147/g.113505 Transcript_53147/m.113505 type:complete len:464 (+) Transcript_53147:89-1480(+)
MAAFDVEQCRQQVTSEDTSTDCSSNLDQGCHNKDSVSSLDSPQKSTGGIFRSGGTAPTAVCLSKAAIGAGVLSMSAHAAEVGLVFQLLGLLAGAALTLVSIQMIARASVQTQRWSYEDIGEELFHPAMSMLTGFMNVCNCLGSAAGYLIICGQVFQVVSGASSSMRQLFVVLVGVLICGPLALARHVSFMRHLAAWSVGFLMLLVLVVVIFLGENGTDETLTPTNFWFGSGAVSIFAYMNSANNIVFAYNNQFNVPQLTGELTPEPTVKRMSMVGIITVILCFLLFASVSVFGVLAFGVGDNQQDSLVLDLRPMGRNPLVLLSLLGVMLSVLTCFQFHVYPIRQFCGFAERKLRGRAVEEADVEWKGRTVSRWIDMAVSLTSVAIVIVIAVVVTSLKTILDFIGAFASAWISFVVPALWQLQLLRRREDFSWVHYKTLGCLALLGLGLFFFVFGTYSAIIAAE